MLSSYNKPTFPPPPGWLKSFLDPRNRSEGTWWDLKWRIPDSIDQTIVAFANDFNDLGGGYIIVGLDAKGVKPDGLTPIELDQDELKCQAKAKECHPAIFGLCEGERLDLPDGRILAAFWVPRSPSRPHTAIDDRFYLRAGTMCRAAQPHEVSKLFTAPRPWESANYVQLSKWKEAARIAITLVPEGHPDISKKCYDGAIGPLEPTHVSLQIYQTGQTVSVPLDDLLLSEDSTRARPMIIFKKDRWRLFGTAWAAWSGR